jgi:glutathione S-transferase
MEGFMKLRYTPISNYIQTVEAVINYAGLRDRVEPVPTRPFEPGIDLADYNPLGTVPTLIRDNGSALYGGLVIYEYLDSLHDEPPLYPTPGEPRWQALRRAWLADGMFDAMVRIIVEAWEPPDAQRQSFIARQWLKIVRGLDALEAEAAGFGALDIGQARAVGAISFIALKIAPTSAASPHVDGGFDWRHGRPALSGWFDVVSAMEMFAMPLMGI